MVNSARRSLQLNRREALQTISAAVVLAAAPGASDLADGAQAATPSVTASDPAGSVFCRMVPGWP